MHAQNQGWYTLFIVCMIHFVISEHMYMMHCTGTVDVDICILEPHKPCSKIACCFPLYTMVCVCVRACVYLFWHVCYNHVVPVVAIADPIVYVSY